MKSGKQRRQEMNLDRAARRAADAALAQAARLEERIRRAAIARGEKLRSLTSVSKKILVNPANLGPNVSCGWPEFVHRGYYVDLPFTCKTCGIHEVWTATQQKWWYESAKGQVWTVAVLCRPCRVKERARKIAARKEHLEGIERKRESAIKTPK